MKPNKTEVIKEYLRLIKPNKLTNGEIYDKMGSKFTKISRDEIKAIVQEYNRPK